MLALALKAKVRYRTPVVWSVLSKEGSSSAEEGVALFRRFLRLARAEDIRVFAADREFIGEECLAFLANQKIPFACVSVAA